MTENQKLAQSILNAVGGAKNVVSLTHCMTRLRFVLKDETIPNQDAIKKMEGVLGVIVSGGQFQIVVGQIVPKIYQEICKLGNLGNSNDTNEKVKEKLTLKSVGKIF